MNSPVTKAPLLVIDNLSVTLPIGADRKFAVHEISFELNAGETLCIVGESGSGKSITSQTILGLLPDTLRPTSGAVRFEGTDLLRAKGVEMRSIRGRRISMIFQEASAALNPVRTIGDQIGEMIRAHEKPSNQELGRRIIELLTEVGLPDPEALKQTYPFRLSGGQQQRVMIAMALALRPSVLIADEPTTALDVTTQAQILDLIRDLQKRHDLAVLFVTHDMGVVADLADRIIVMRDGEIVESGTKDDVLYRPNHDYTKKLISAVPRLDATLPDVEPHDHVLQVGGLRKTFANHASSWLLRLPPIVAVDDVSFVLGRGETLGIVGESGSGKSTAARCVMRLTEPDAGNVQLGDLAFSALRGDALRLARKHIQIIFQDPFASLNPRQTVETIVGTPLRAQGVSGTEARDRSAEMLELVGLQSHVLDRYPHEFSGGQRQRIGIARALVVNPDVLIADEAVSSLDVSVQAQVLELLQDIKEKMSLSMIFITHDLRVAAQICDRVLVMHRGKIVEQGATRNVFETPEHDYTRNLLAAVPGRKWQMDHLQFEAR